MHESQKTNAGVVAGASVDLAGGLESTNQIKSDAGQFSTSAEILANKSTATEVQLAKLIVLLRQGPKTTIELRSHAIMMPDARVFQLKNEHGYNITTELVALYDADGVRHSRCARYHLMAADLAEEGA